MTLRTLVLGNCGIFYSKVMQDVLHQQGSKGFIASKIPVPLSQLQKGAWFRFWGDAFVQDAR